MLAKSFHKTRRLAPITLLSQRGRGTYAGWQLRIIRINAPAPHTHATPLLAIHATRLASADASTGECLVQWYVGDWYSHAAPLAQLPYPSSAMRPARFRLQYRHDTHDRTGTAPTRLRALEQRLQLLELCRVGTSSSDVFINLKRGCLDVISQLLSTRGQVCDNGQWSADWLIWLGSDHW